MNQPTVSIILPTYNREKFLPEAFAAIKSQTFTDWELIIVDDGSTDNTRELVAQLTSDLTQPVRYIYQENQGPYGARNNGLDLATGKYIAFYDSDDLWLPHHLQDCVDGLDANPDVDWVYGACRIVDHKSGNELSSSTFYVDGKPRPFMRLHHRKSDRLRIIEDSDATRCQILHGFYCGLQNSVIHSRLFQNYRFEAATRNEAEDQIIVIKALKSGKKLAWIDSIHVVYRIHDANSSASSAGNDIDRKIRVLKTQINIFENLLQRSILSKRETRALRRSLSKQYFWHLGYSLLWMNERRTEALEMFRRGLQHWRWDWRCWKTYLLARTRAGVPQSVKTCWWYLTDSHFRDKYSTNRQRVKSFRQLQRRAMNAIIADKGAVVLGGPFRGLQYTAALRSGTYCAQVLLGTYEKELWPIIEAICQRNYCTIVDIGTAEGYYLCGLARRNPESRIVGFEANASLHRLLRQQASSNRIDNLELYGKCDSETLRNLVGDGTDLFVLCDVDGAEAELIDPELVPGLRRADLLIETHDLIRPNVTTLLENRFKKSHKITTIETVQRSLRDIPPESQLDEDLALAAMDEFRGGKQLWLWMTYRRDNGNCEESIGNYEYSVSNQ